jgi:hypothetical protein
MTASIESLGNRIAGADYPLVSCICPTYGRAERHVDTYASFRRQTYPHKELLVLDDSPEPSPFFTRLVDWRVRYWHVPTRMSIGQKRNILIGRASGEIIAHQDDDDQYRKDYLTTMLARLGSRDFCKLSVFNIHNEKDGSKWQWDTRRLGGTHTLINATLGTVCVAMPSNVAKSDAIGWGYGFSYVYRKKLWETTKFEDVNLREDYKWICAVRKALGDASSAKLVQVADCPALVWHNVHNANTSRSVFPQVRLDGPQPYPAVTATASAAAAAAGLAIAGPLGLILGGIGGLMCSNAYDAYQEQMVTYQPPVTLPALPA